MAYLGGKAKSADHILAVLNNPVFDNYNYIEPFCGYCHILRRVKNKKTYTISDNNRLLIVLLKHIQKTKNKHPTITKQEYITLKENTKKNPLKSAYAAFCYSYNGKYFGGFVEKYGDRNYPNERKKYYDQLHDTESFHLSKIQENDYTKYNNIRGALIYCDPPYANTTEYHSEFNSNAFWDNIRKLSKNNYVFISEYNAPKDFICLVKKMKRMSLSGKGATRKNQEKLFFHESKKDDPLIKELTNKKEHLHNNESKRQTRKIKK
jgi:DNA adenine methylase